MYRYMVFRIPYAAKFMQYSDYQRKIFIWILILLKSIFEIEILELSTNQTVQKFFGFCC